MNLNLNDDQLRTVMAAAIVEHLTPENREKLIAGAIQLVLKPDQSYGGQKSPLELAFRDAARQVAVEIVGERMKDNSEIRTALESIVSEAVQRVFVQNREKTVEKMADALADALKIDRY